MSNIELSKAIYIDLTQAQAEYSISKRTLWTWIGEGRLKAFQPLRKTLIRRAELEALIEKGRVNADLDKLVDEMVKEVIA